MQGWATTMTAVAVAFSVLSMLDLLRQRAKRDHEVLFTVVSGSLALTLMSPWMGNAPEWMKWMVAIGGSATCNGFWLVSRALFRSERGVRLQQVLIAVGVALLIAIHRGTAMHAGVSASILTVALDALLALTSASLLTLTFLEPLRGWSTQWSRGERRLRLTFMAVYGSCVLSTTLLGELAHAFPGLAPWRTVAIAFSASVMIVFTHLAFRYRRRVQAPSSDCVRRSSVNQISAPNADDVRLMALLRHHLEVLQVYREPNLKVAELASQLGTTEHRLSKLISQQLGAKNFNQLLNRHRVSHACELLAVQSGFENVLHVSGESGFASLGPFNRAFKSLVGCTPTAYRTRCIEGSPQVVPDSAGLQLRPD